MLLEYLEDPDAELHARVLLLYDLVPDEVGGLRDAINQLRRGKLGDELRVDALPSVSSVDGSSLAATLGEEDLGVEPVANADRQFRCTLTAGAWQRAYGLLEPFQLTDGQGFQYLTEAGPVEWIISHDRGW